MSFLNEKQEDAGLEFELMEFKISDNTFGIEVSKVIEIMMSADVKQIPHSHPSVEGVFKPRDIVLTVIDLPGYLNIATSENQTDRDLFIVTNLQNLNLAFRVHSVVSIDRVHPNDIQAPNEAVYGTREGVAIGLIEFEGRLITILDFEKIVRDISVDSHLQQVLSE